MGHIRFRRSIPLGSLFRLNVGKRGVSVTAGRRRGGPHVTTHVDGRVTTSVGLPGTGLSYVDTRRVRSCRSGKAWGSFLAAALIITFVIIALLG